MAKRRRKGVTLSKSLRVVRKDARKVGRKAGKEVGTAGRWVKRKLS